MILSISRIWQKFANVLSRLLVAMENETHLIEYRIQNIVEKMEYSYIIKEATIADLVLIKVLFYI